MRVEHFDIARPFAFTAPRHGNRRGYFIEIFDEVPDFHSKTHDRNLNWADTDVAIDWPLPKQATPALSDKDRDAPMLENLAVELKEFA